MSDNKIVQGLWFYGDLPLLQQISIASFLANGHDYHLYTYGPVGKVPSGTTLRDAAEMMCEVKVFQDRGEKGYATFADGFRYALLLERGGWWVDTDVVCLKFFDFSAEYVFASEHVPENSEAVLPNNAIIKAPMGAPVLQYALEVC
ncbi:MAG TPA: glycosyltransferase, partial [Bryobacteraceae bacterium]|nr:glycosyltransferase [Bryobacteraceae bacterium]